MSYGATQAARAPYPEDGKLRTGSQFVNSGVRGKSIGRALRLFSRHVVLPSAVTKFAGNARAGKTAIKTVYRIANPPLQISGTKLALRTCKFNTYNNPTGDTMDQAYIKSDRNERNGEPSGERRPLIWRPGAKSYASTPKPAPGSMPRPVSDPAAIPSTREEAPQR